MIEVEVKARSRPDTPGRILALGAAPAGTEVHQDIYYSSPSRDFRLTDEALRLRIKEGSAFLTYKGPRLDQRTKSREELTVEVDDPQSMEKILEALGFVRAGEVRKRRTKYVLRDLTFALDEVEGLGTFVEVEARAGPDWEEKRKRVLELLGCLGLDEPIRSSYLELLESTR